MICITTHCDAVNIQSKKTFEVYAFVSTSSNFRVWLLYINVCNVHLKFLSDLAREICHGLSFLSRKLGKENCLNEWTYLAEYIIYIVVIHMSFLLDAFGILCVGQIRRLFASNECWSSQQHLCIACLWHLRSSHWIWILLCQLWVSCVITEVIFTTA